MHTIHGSWNESPDAVTLIDAHHHLWDLAQAKHPNLVGAPRHDFFMGDNSAIRRDYLPDDYRRDAALTLLRRAIDACAVGQTGGVV